MVLFLAFVVALSITTGLIPVLARWAPSIGLTDAPGPRKVHSTPVPRVGGLAMTAGILITTLLAVPLSVGTEGLLAGIVVLLPFGLWDDRKQLGYGPKLVGQIIAVALCMAIGGVRIGAINFWGMEIAPAVGEILTFIFLIGITNAVNLTDGLDGLAGGLVLLCLVAIALFAAASGNVSVTAVASIEAGAILGFLRFNTHPARIFMGDAGSQVLGFSVGVLSLLATKSEISAISPVLPLLLLGLPIIDTATVMVTRILAGRSPFVADKNHLHHRLLSLGFAHREAVLIVYILQVGLVLLAYFMRFQSDPAVALTFAVFAAAFLGLLFGALQCGWRLSGGAEIGVFRRTLGELMRTRVPALSLFVTTACLCLYATTVIASSRHIGIDVGVLSLAMIAVLLLVTWNPAITFQWFERACVYVSVVLLVYLDQTAPDKAPVMSTVSWSLIAAAGVAGLLRFLFSPTRRFEVTTLDLLVVFIALVLPNLPGSFVIASELTAGLAKAVILLYVVELLLTLNLRRLVPRLALMVMLAVIAGRALMFSGS